MLRASLLPLAKRVTATASTAALREMQPSACRPAVAHLVRKQIHATPSDEKNNVPAPHPGLRRAQVGGNYLLMNPIYSKEELDIVPHHRPPVTALDSAAMNAVHATRLAFDKMTGYPHDMNEKKWLQRICFLETVAGVPGMVAGVLRHLRSLRRMERDHGWIHTLLEEAENERMHLLTFLKLREPGIFFRAAVLGAQGVFFNAFFLAYIVSPRFCHRFVGYLEEEAVRTYTHCLEDLDNGKLPQWENRDAPQIAVEYWQLGEGAKMRDLLLAVRADEACHSHVNHTFASMRPDEQNPFGKGDHSAPEFLASNNRQ